MKNRLFILISLTALAFLSCTQHFIKGNLKSQVKPNSIGVAVQLNEKEDTTSISHELNEYLENCGYSPLSGLFKKEVYLPKNYATLFNIDSVFIHQQPGLNQLNQLLVCKVEFIEKKDESSAKNNVWITFLGRWIQMKPLKKIHDFYFVEKVENTENAKDREMLISFLIAQMHVKFCYEIEKYIAKKN